MKRHLIQVLKRSHILDKIASKLVFDPPKKSTYHLNKHNEIIIASKGNFNVEAKKVSLKVECHFVDSKIFVVAIYPDTFDSIDRCNKVLLYSHGTSVDIGGCVKVSLKMMHIIDENSTGLVLWDFPGYGLSKGKPSEKSMNDGIIQVYNFVTNNLRVNGNYILNMGFSLGSVPATFLSTKFLTCPIMAVILISPLVSAYLAIKGKKTCEDPVGVFSNLETLNNGICPWPVFVAHGTDDNVVNTRDCALLVKSFQRFPRQDQLDTCIDLFGTESALYESDSEVYWKSRISYCPVVGAGHNSIIKNSSFIGSTHQFVSAL